MFIAASEAGLEVDLHLNENPVAFVIRRGTLAERDRLRDLYRDAVLAAGPQLYTPEQVAAWASSADDIERWNTWMRDGSTWVAVDPHDLARAIGVASLYPQDHVHLLYVDPALHRRGIARALLARVEGEAREARIPELTTDASLISHPVFLDSGYEVIAWEEYAHRGQVFRRARMGKVLR